MGPRIEELEAQVAAMLAEAEATDMAEDAEFGEDKRGDELPPELATKEGRLAKLEPPRNPSRPRPRRRQRKKPSKRPRTRGQRAGGPSRRGEGGRGGTPPGRAQRKSPTPSHG